MGYDWTLKTSLAKGYRNPSFREMYLYAVANPDLAPESMMNYEPTVGKHFFAHLDNFTDAKYMTVITCRAST